MNTINRIVLMACASLTCAEPAFANIYVMTFSGIGPGNNFQTSYTESAITVTNDDGLFVGYPTGGMLHLDPEPSNNGTYVFSFGGGYKFDLLSFDVTCCGDLFPIAVLAATDKYNFPFKTQEFNLSAGGTFNFTGWTGMRKLYIFNSGEHFSIDNLRIEAVPEPMSWSMMISGLALAGAAMRRKRGPVSFV